MDRFDPAETGFKQVGYRFGEFRLETDGTLLRGEAPVPLAPQELTALRLLLARKGEVVTSRQLKQAVWGQEPVAADSVPKCLASLRRRLEPGEWIETVYKRGYRFSAPALLFAGHAASTLPRLAILPFATEYGVPEYLGSAIAEEAGARLGETHSAAATILSRESAFALARRGLVPRQIGEMLEADLVLNGELRSVASRYRVRAAMIRVQDGSEIWVEEMLVDRSRLAGLEAELVRRVAIRLDGSELPEPASTSAARERHEPPSEQSEAYELLARARHEWQTLERHRMQDALQHLLRALELDPNLVAARVNLAHLCVKQALCGFVPAPAAADIVRRTTEAIPDHPLRAEAVLPALGWISFHVDRNLPAALWAFERSSHLPHDPWITRARSLFALSRHRFGEAIELLHSAIHLDPYAGWLQAQLAWAHHLAGESSASAQLARTALDRFPEHKFAHFYAAQILAFNGETAAAMELARTLTQRFPYFDPAPAGYAYTLALAGRKGEAHAVLERLQWLSRERFAMKTFAPAAYVALGDFDTALAELNIADETRCPWFFQILADPSLKPLHGRPGFESMNGILAGMEAEAERNRLGE